MKYLTIGICSLLCISSAYGRERADHVEKRMSLETGARQSFYREYEKEQTSGGTVSFDYAWKVGGINAGKSTWLSIPIGVTFQTDLPNIHRDSWILAYGWGITHELSRGKKVTPILGYGLLLNQMHDTRHPSSIFGHQTRFTAGADAKLSDKTVLTWGADYSITRFPDRDREESMKSRSVELHVGIRLLRPGTVKEK